MRLFATALPGLRTLLADEITTSGFDVVSDTLHDGRNDIVTFDAAPRDAVTLRLSEDVFALVGTSGARKLGALARDLLPPAGLERALSAYAEVARPLRKRMGFRVIARVRGEERFLRTAFRDAVTDQVLELRPRWTVADPADLELWALEWAPGRYGCGVRLSGAGMRQRGGRERERPGALRPTVAAAMVRLAGTPDGVLCDPCCGTGTILTEGAAVGWQVTGGDIDPTAVEAARRNIDPPLARWDVHRLPFADGRVGAIATNLPFGERFTLPGSPDEWYKRTADELLRASRGPVVVLAPERWGNAVPEARKRAAVSLLGVPTVVWTLR